MDRGTWSGLGEIAFGCYCLFVAWRGLGTGQMTEESEAPDSSEGWFDWFRPSPPPIKTTYSATKMPFRYWFHLSWYLVCGIGLILWGVHTLW
jgi:hypothetical protein